MIRIRQKRTSLNDEWGKGKVMGFKTWRVGVGVVPLGSAPLSPFRAFKVFYLQAVFPLFMSICSIQIEA